MIDLYQQVNECVSWLGSEMDSEPDVAVILGTGLGAVAERLEVSRTIPYEEIPHFPESTAIGHRGALVCGTLADLNVAVMQGRYHYYEGYTLQQVTLPVRALRRLGARILIIVSAAGGLDPLFQLGDVMVVIDHINLIGDNPLRGVSDDRLGDRFPDMSRPYDADLIKIVGEAARDLRLTIRHGVYAAVPGPSLETPAETRMLRLLGADAVGMSTAPEVIVARQIGFRTMALTAVTNVNLPDRMEPILVDAVIANAELANPKLAAILEETLRRIK